VECRAPGRERTTDEIPDPHFFIGVKLQRVYARVVVDAPVPDDIHLLARGDKLHAAV
jgi:hypothetical protein